MDFSVNMKREKRTLIVRLEGELDHHTSDIVRTKIDKEIDKGVTQNLLFNLEKLSFMDSSGLGMLLGRYKKISQHDGEMSVCCVGENVYKIFELSGIFKVLSVYDTETQAISTMGVA